MYLSASRQFDTVVVWEQRNENGTHKIRTYDTPYNCFLKIQDWVQVVTQYRDSVESGQPNRVLKEFIQYVRMGINEKTVHKSMYNDDLYKLEFESGRVWRKFLESVPTDIRLWESDVPPELKVLSQHYYKADDPKLRATFYDIEIDYDPAVPFEGAMNPQFPLNSIAFYHTWKDEYVVFAVPPKTWRGGPDLYSILVDDLFTNINSKYTITLFTNEAELLMAMVEEIQQCDLMSGWNSALFDDPYIAQRVELVLGDEWFQLLSFPRGKAPYYRELEIMYRKQKQVQFDGRITIDYMDLFKKFTVEDRDSWSLESVSADHLGDRFKKLDYEGTLNELYTGKYARANLSGEGDDPLTKLRYQLQLVQQEMELRGIAEPTEFPLVTHRVQYPKRMSTLTDADLLMLFDQVQQEVVRYSFSKFVRYNIRDTEVLSELDKKYKFITLGNNLVHQSTCHYRNVVGTVRTAEMSIINFCWYELNKRVPDTLLLEEQGQAAGAYVLVPQLGLKEWIACFDINSLYPNTIRTVNISPEMLVGQFVDFERAWTAIFNSAQTMLTIRWELDNVVETKTAAEWRQILIDRKMAVSGYGTVFSQEAEGIIPSLLGKWYADRKMYQAKAEEAQNKIIALKADTSADNKLEIDRLQSEYEYFDALQYIFKIKLNSQYGALLNQNFKFYDKRMGQSVTASGRVILQHQIRKGCEIIDGNYNIDPIVDDEDPRAIRGEIASPSLVYGDTDSVVGDTEIIVNGSKVKIGEFFDGVSEQYIRKDDARRDYVKIVTNCTSLGFDGNAVVERPINYVMKHTVKKRLFKIVVGDKHVTVTEDHSIIVRRSGEIVSVRPQEILCGDKIIHMQTNVVWFALAATTDETEEFGVIDLGVQEVDVYDIEVAGVHNFFANDILVHNSLYCTLSAILPPSPDPKLVIKIADAIGKEINESFPAFNRSAFLCQPGFDKYIRTGRELVADKGFYIQKKRYVIHVIDKEGKAKDDLKAMGVDMRKTTTPRPVRKFLREVCYDLLTGVSDSVIDQHIMEYRDNMIDNVPVMDVGLPKGVKKVELYTKEFYADSKARLPGHVAASILYNEMRDANKDTLSLQIVSGMKIKVFNFEYDIEHRGRKFNSIALPTDTELLPAWFLRDFVPLIDRVKHSKKLVDNMLHNMFDSIPRHVPTRHREALMSDFEWE